MNPETEKIKLTHYSHGAGCGCKIAPDILRNILQSNVVVPSDARLLVGNNSSDDAAVYDIGNGEAIISTTDFFMPIVDDPEDFGGIASVNAISDVYAMGGTPLVAIAILGWPVDKIPVEIASMVLEGSRKACMNANIILAGGHSIDAPEPIFGLAVTGKVKHEFLKRNNTAKPNSLLYLTKPLGAGIVTTAQKRGIVRDEDLRVVRDNMLTLNNIGEALGRLTYVNALTDVTGFGLLGHLKEMCEGSRVSATVWSEMVPRFPFLETYLEKGSIPGGTGRNLKSYKDQLTGGSDLIRQILADPQTSGGLLISIDAHAQKEFEVFMAGNGHKVVPFGQLKELTSPLIAIE